MKSAYYVDQQRKKIDVGGTSYEGEVDKVWRQVWRLEVPSVVKSFLWKTVNKILPTRLKMWKRKIVEDPRCLVCKIVEEFVIHILWCCPASSNVWAKKVSLVNKWKTNCLDFIQLWIEMYKKLPKEKLEEVGVIMKNILYRRNKYYFEDKFICPSKVIKIAIAGLEKFHQAYMGRGGG